MTFKIDYWHAKLIYNLGKYKTLGDMINNEAIIKEYFDDIAKKFKKYNISIGNDWKEDITPIIQSSYQYEVMDAYSHYSSMMIVTVATYIEAMISEFYITLFSAKPNLMHNYIIAGEQGDKAGRVSLKEILAHNNIEHLKLGLAKKSAKNASNGNFNSVISRIKDLTKCECEQGIIKDIEQLMITRQRVIHEAADIHVDFDEIKKHFNNAELLLKYLGRCCQKTKLPFSDQGYLVTSAPAFDDNLAI